MKNKLIMYCAYYLLDQMLETNADTFELKIKGITKEKKELSNFKLVITKED